MTDEIRVGTLKELSVAEAVFADGDTEVLFAESDPETNRRLSDF